MTPPGPHGYDHDKVPLFWTSTTPVDTGLLDKVCREAADACTLEPPVRLEYIRHSGDGVGNFAGWTPLQVASRYVMPRLVDDPKNGFVSLTFVVIDNKAVESGKVLLVSIDWDSFEPGAELRRDESLRTEAEYAAQLPVLFHEGVQYPGMYEGTMETE